jgi:glycosyltransferase involved in cell wall biosynthesis
MIKSNYVFIGAINLNGSPNCGETIKNFTIVNYLKDKSSKIEIIDTLDWRKRPFVVFKIINAILFYRKRKFIISASTNSVYLLTKYMNFFLKDLTCFYFAIGNTVHYFSIDKMKYYKVYDKIFVEGQVTMDKFMQLGFSNFNYLPNFKKTNFSIERIKSPTPDKLKLVFVSRIVEQKGVYILLEAVKELNKLGYQSKIDLVYFGPGHIENIKLLNSAIAKIDNITYGGVLDFFDSNSYSILSSFDILVFPSFWHGEGFPGVIIDAYISGLAVIATDWNLNSEIVKDGINGKIIIPNSQTDLINSILYFMENILELQRIKNNNIICSKKFDSTSLLDKVFD